MLNCINPTKLFCSKEAIFCINNNDGLISKKKCGKLDSYRPADNACGTCGWDLTGEWTYTPIDSSNSPGTARTITFTQSNGTFEGSNDFHTIMGKVEGRWIRLTQTVSGEEGEGYVLLAEGAIKEFESGFLLAPLAVVADTPGDGGALILRKAAP
ncbi:MAG: hypothetical protein R3A13_07655 [Bdellovibrionota bacterium]